MTTKRWSKNPKTQQRNHVRITPFVHVHLEPFYRPYPIGIILLYVIHAFVLSNMMLRCRSSTSACFHYHSMRKIPLWIPMKTSFVWANKKSSSSSSSSTSSSSYTFTNKFHLLVRSLSHGNKKHNEIEQKYDTNQNEISKDDEISQDTNQNHTQQNQNITSSSTTPSSASSSNTTSYWDRWEDFHFSTKLVDLRKLIQREDIIHLVTNRMFSLETAEALKKVMGILQNVSNHGIVDVFALYPAWVVASAILSLSRLQSISQYYNTHKNTSHHSNEANLLMHEKELIHDLAHYAIFAGVAYGWKFHLLLQQELHIGDATTLTRRTGIHERDIIATNWKSRTHLPAYYIVRDTKKETIVLCIRGTLSAKDILTDLCCTADEFVPFDDYDDTTYSNSIQHALRWKHTSARAHQGMIESARGVAEKTRKIIASQLAKNPTYNLVIVGHSLGGGVAAVLGTFWKNTFPGLKVFAYGCPCVGPLGVHPTINNSIVSVVGEGDPFSFLSLGHLADLSAALSRLCENNDLRTEVLQRTAKRVDDMDEEDVRWCYEAMVSLREVMTAEKLYPPGRIVYIGFDDDGNVSLELVKQQLFRELKLHPRMMDVSRHVPHHYESALSKLRSSIEDQSN